MSEFSSGQEKSGDSSDETEGRYVFIRERYPLDANEFMGEPIVVRQYPLIEPETQPDDTPPFTDEAIHPSRPPVIPDDQPPSA